mmetsp:Transcript_101674/g.286658  ORF Transcript_101674/g.286658 Transcript_101674/m.286658 type:complete len:301 (-) Transcript_101674:34-936(-)
MAGHRSDASVLVLLRWPSAATYSPAVSISATQCCTKRLSLATMTNSCEGVDNKSAGAPARCGITRAIASASSMPIGCCPSQQYQRTRSRTMTKHPTMQPSVVTMPAGSQNAPAGTADGAAASSEPFTRVARSTSTRMNSSSKPGTACPPANILSATRRARSKPSGVWTSRRQPAISGASVSQSACTCTCGRQQNCPHREIHHQTDPAPLRKYHGSVGLILAVEPSASEPLKSVAASSSLSTIPSKCLKEPATECAASSGLGSCTKASCTADVCGAAEQVSTSSALHQSAVGRSPSTNPTL